jgi:hypothetical protein
MSASTSFFKTTGTQTFSSVASAAQTRLYLGSSSANPTVDLSGDVLKSGMLYTNINDSKLYYYSGSAWIEASPDTNTGILNVVEDVTPQLGGDLDSNGSDIVMAADDIIQLGTDVNTSSLLLHDSGQNSTRIQSAGFSFMNRAGSNLTAAFYAGAAKTVILYYQGNEKLSVKTSGVSITGNMSSTTATVAGITYPPSDGTAGQVMTTDGSGAVTFQTPSSGASVGSAIAFAIAL